MAANDERLRARCEELEDKVDDLEDETEELQGRLHSSRNAVERWIHDARHEGVARIRAEDERDDDRREYRAYREQSHKQLMGTMGVVADVAKRVGERAAQVSPVPGTADADATLREAAARLAAPQEGVAFRPDMDVAAILALAVQYGRQATDAEVVGAAAARRERSARALVKLSREEKNFAGCRQAVAMALFDATRQMLFRRTKSTVYMTVLGYIRHINAKLPRGAAQLNTGTASYHIRTGWVLVHAHGPTKLNGVEIGRDLFDRKKWSKIRAVDDHGTQLGGAECPLAEQKTLEFVLADGFGKDFLAKLKATGKSVTELLKEATGKATAADKISKMKDEVAAWDKKIADLKKALAEKRRIKAELLRRVAALEAVGSV